VLWCRSVLIILVLWCWCKLVILVLWRLCARLELLEIWLASLVVWHLLPEGFLLLESIWL